MSDSDELDEIPDFSTLLTRSRQKGKLKRGAKDFAPQSSATQDNAVANARNALFEVIAEERKGSIKTTSTGIFDQDGGLTTIVQNKGTHLHTMGHTLDGKITLYPEEAAWLLSRSALVANDKHNNPCKMEDYYNFMFAESDSWITFEKYQRYIRISNDWVTSSCDPDNQIRSKIPYRRHWAYSAYDRCLGICEFFEMDKAARLRLSVRDIWYDGSVYSTLQIIPSSPCYKPFETSSASYTFDWDVYKPNPKWKKREPGIPDFKHA
ncbi:tRNA-splicing endonuclease subunit sen54 [Apophysomyces sp. BC1021]|nr:tRNA-splicing endonuclease subunit sen54 [Apophysomyces sp. BC1021]